MVAAVAVCAAVGGCGNSEKGGNPEAPSSPQPASEGHQVAASDVASIKDANAAIRACRSGGVATPQIRQGVTALLVVYRSAGPEARYESNLNPVPINMRGVVQNAERALRRCGHATEAQRLAAALDEG
jgi:hypothetical protein